MWKKDGRVYKQGIGEQGRKLGEMEQAWYQKAKELGYDKLPNIYSLDPIIMEEVAGCTIYQCKEYSIDAKKKIIAEIVCSLKKLHHLEKVEIDDESVRLNYKVKTWERLMKVKALLPYTDQEYICVNGRKCHNVFRFAEVLDELIDSLTVKEFCFIHGDCTFSNMLLRTNGELVLIDPRGYFGKTSLYGDPAYDWAKVYYSIVGNYDNLNLGKFRLHMGEEGIEVVVESNGFEELEEYYLELIKDQVDIKQIKLMHGLIWLSLTAYIWQDYDSVCAAFFWGLYFLEEVWTNI